MNIVSMNLADVALTSKTPEAASKRVAQEYMKLSPPPVRTMD